MDRIDRKIEQETSAIVTYFKLLKQGQLSKHEKRDYQAPVFELIGGVDNLRSLEIAIKEGYFDCDKTNMELLNQLSNNLGYVRDNFVSTSVLTEQIMAHGWAFTMKDINGLNKSQYSLPSIETLCSVLPYEIVVAYIDKLRIAQQMAEINKNQKTI